MRFTIVKEIAMRGMLVLAAAMTVCAATPAAANWGYNGGANYGNASYGGGDYAYSGYGGYGYGYGNLSSHGAAMPSWGDCPCCNNVWAGYCEEKAARAANRHCNSCGNGGCGRVKHLGRKCGKSCDSCGAANGDCGCNGEAATEEASPDSSVPTTEQPTPPPAPEAPPASASTGATSTSATQLPLLSGIAWLTAVVLNR